MSTGWKWHFKTWHTLQISGNARVNDQHMLRVIIKMENSEVVRTCIFVGNDNYEVLRHWK
jgi:hypothetical protein